MVKIAGKALGGHLESHLADVVTWMRLARVFSKIQRRAAEQLQQDWGVSLAHFDVLAQMEGNEGLTQQELADRLLLTKGNICQLLDKMECERLLVRQREGRVNRLFLTERGRQLLAAALPAHQALIAESLSALSPCEQATLRATLRKLDDALE